MPDSTVRTTRRPRPAPQPLTAGGTDTDPPPAETGRAGRAGRRVDRRIIAGGLIVAVLAVTAGFFGYQVRQAGAESQLRASALTAARQAALDFTTYDYRSLGKDFARVTAQATGTFKTSFAAQATKLSSLLVQAKATASGQIITAGVAQLSPRTATVLVILDDHVQNVTAPSGTVKHYRMTVELSRVHGRWLVSQLAFPA